MKHKSKVLLLILLTLTLVGCSKNKLSPYDFATSIQDDFDVSNISDKISSPQINSAYLARKKDDLYQIEFYVCNTELDCKTLFEANLNNLKELEKNQEKQEEYNYSKLITYDEEYYYVVSRIEDTMIYIKTNLSNKEEVTSLLNKINY